VWKMDPKLESSGDPEIRADAWLSWAADRHAPKRWSSTSSWNMFARACKGMSTAETIKQAESELKEIYGKA